MMKFISFLTIFFLALLESIVTPFLYFFFKFLKMFPKVQDFIEERYTPSQLAKILQQKKTQKPALLFFCSSAGEYEQAKPLEQRFKNFDCIFVLYSPSGFKYAKKRQESSLYFLSPLCGFWGWYKILKIINPRYVFIVRHEFWPSFYFISCFLSQIVVVNFSFHKSQKSLSSKISTLFKLNFLRLSSYIFCVESADEKILTDFNIKALAVGDSKFDRALERSQNETLKQTYLQKNDNSPVVVFGSCYAYEIDLLNSIQSDLALLSKIRFVFAPHLMDKSYLQTLKNKLASMHINAKFWSELNNPEAPEVQNIIVDEIGFLAELYSLASLTVVGGAFHNKVHNVLEPAIYGGFLATGPNIFTSHEAVLLSKIGFLTILNNTDDFKTWLLNSLRTLTESDLDHLKSSRKRMLLPFFGASDRIVKNLEAKQ